MGNAAERRQFFRSTFHSPVHLGVRGRRTEGQLLDVSLKGALVKIAADWPGQTGDACQLRLDLAPGVVILMETVVAHAASDHVGLRCKHIDVDSMTHLRQLVEHNAQDPSLLERDLANLVH